MSLSIPGMGGRVSAWHRQRPQQSPSGSGPPGTTASEAVQADEVSTSAGAEQAGRTEIAGINQAIRTTEEGLALVSVARHGLEAVHHRLGRMNGIMSRTLDGAHTGIPAPQVWAEALSALEADAQAIDRLALGTNFGGTKLLDGSFGCRGAAFGPWIEFVSAGDRVRSSPPEGYAVVLTQEPTRASILGTEPLSSEHIAAGEILDLEVDGHAVSLTTREGQSAPEIVSALQEQLVLAGLPLGVVVARGDRLLVHHQRYGRAWKFRVRSRTRGVLSPQAGKFADVANGRDISGTIHGEPAEGNGQLLVGLEDNRCTADLAIRYTGTPPPGFEPPEARGRGYSAAPSDGWKDSVLDAGRVLVVQRALTLRLSVKEMPGLRLDSMACANLGRGGEHSGDLASIEEVLHARPEQALEVLRLLERARSRVDATLSAALYFEREVLTEHLARLRVEVQNLLARQGAEQLPEDIAAWVARVGQLLCLDGYDALTAQRYPRPTAMLKLLSPDEDCESGIE